MQPTSILGGAAEGNWFIEMVNEYPYTNSFGEKIAFEINLPLSVESNYKLSFSIRKPPTVPTGCLDAKNNYIKVGVSNYNNQFGTHLYTSPLGSDEWQEYSIVFNTQNAEEYVTVEVGAGDTTNIAIHLDGFILTETTEPVSVQEVNSNNKQLLKIMDVLCKESSPNATGLLFYIYSDGTVEKRIVVE